MALRDEEEEGRLLVEVVEKDGGANALERKGESPTRIQVNAFMLQSSMSGSIVVDNNNISSLKRIKEQIFGAGSTRKKSWILLNNKNLKSTRAPLISCPALLLVPGQEDRSPGGGSKCFYFIVGDDG
jgi:hypothetical protein